MTKKSLLYTKTGDGGKTSLFGGKRVSKTNQRIAAIGSIDEVNANLGVVHSLTKSKTLSRLIEIIQNHLFSLGANLANPEKATRFDPKNTAFLEKEIDDLDAKIPQLRNFILPGGSLASSQTQTARSVARRAEREVVKLSLEEKVDSEILKYLNRLADFLFVLARYQNKLSRKKEKIWKESSF